MGRDASKSLGNVYYEARKNAAMWNDSLYSREHVARDILGMDESTLGKIERGTAKIMDLEVLIHMSELYNAPELKNHFCVKECPLHRENTLQIDPIPLNTSIVRIIKFLKPDICNDAVNTLLDIGQDGVITEDEYERCDDVIVILDQIAKGASALKINLEKARNANGRQ